MNRSLLALVILVVLVCLGAGCATSRSTARTVRPRSFVLAVTVHGSLQPTPQQWAMIQARFARALEAKGWVLVNDVSLADHILRVDFTPDPEAPEDRGHATILSVRRNPLSTVARRGTGPYSNGAFSYSSNFSSGWMSSNFYSNSYYGYGGFYDDGYFGGSGSYTPVIFTPTPKTPPLRHHPGFRDDCPPGHTPGHFAGHTPDPAHDRPRPPPSDYGRWSGEPTTARADRSYSRSGSSYSRSDSSYSRSDTYSPPSPSYSNESSYSPPSYDHASSASSASSSSAVAAAASSAPAVEAVSAARDQ
jgi:hypothetical protein